MILSRTISFTLLITIFLLSSGTADAQLQQELMPASPEAMSLSKMINYPMSHNTGVTSISIPFHTIDVNGISMPMTLNYHASGIKVGQASTWVGLGWSLSFEPQISHAVYGLDDIGNGFGYLSNEKAKKFSFLRSLNSENIEYWKMLSAAERDEEPDRFDYQLLTGSGSFMFQKYNDNTYKAMPIPYRPVKINLDNKKFEVLDELGRHYNFDRSTTSSPDQAVHEKEYISSWKCSSIISPSKKDTVKFNYGTLHHYYSQNYSYSERVEVIDSITYADDYATINNHVYGSLAGTYMRDVYPDVLGQNYLSRMIKIADIDQDKAQIRSDAGIIPLSEVNFRGGRIQFYTSPNLTYGFKLDSIRVFNMQNEITKTIRLFFKSTYQGLRLQLDSLTFSSPGTSSKKYAFQYFQPFNTDNTPVTPPGHWTKASDAWGYFNASAGDESQSNSIAFNSQLDWLDFKQRTPYQDVPVEIGGASKEPAEIFTKFFVLEKIINPFGGKTEFEYSANKYLDNGTLKKAGGLRIEKIKHFNSTDDLLPSTEKIYKYGEDENGAGELKSKLEVNTFMTKQIIIGPNGGYGTRRKRTFHNAAMTDLFFANGSPINYTTVTEYQKDLGVAMGKTVYKYSSFPVNDRYPNTNISIVKIPIEGGQLLSTTQYAYHNGQYSWIQLDTNKYMPYVLPDSIHVGKIYKNIERITPNVEPEISDFLYVTYPQEVGTMLLTGQESKIRSVHDLSKITHKMVNYYYDNSGHMQPTRIENTNSDGSTETNLTTFPLDYPSGTAAIDNMKANHLVTYPIEQVRYLEKGGGKKILAGLANQYQVTGTGLIDRIHKIETNVPIDLSGYKFSNRLIGELPPNGAVASFSLDSKYKEQTSYEGYDVRGNPLTVRPKDGSPIGYKWGYNKLYRVAEVKNATADEFFTEDFEESNISNISTGGAHTGQKSVVGSYTVNWTRPNSRIYLISYWYKVGNLWKFKSPEVYASASLTLSGGTAYDDIRIFPQDAQMTTYTYKPLVGVSSMTDSKDLTTFYEYDNSNRLKYIKNHSGDIIKSFNHHYKFN